MAFSFDFGLLLEGEHTDHALCLGGEFFRPSHRPAFFARLDRGINERILGTVPDLSFSLPLPRIHECSNSVQQCNTLVVCTDLFFFVVCHKPCSLLLSQAICFFDLLFIPFNYLFLQSATCSARLIEQQAIVFVFRG